MIIQTVYMQLFEHWRNYSLNKSWEIIWWIFFIASKPYIWSFISRSKKKRLVGIHREVIMKYSWNIIHLKSYIIDKLTSLLVIKTQMSHVIFYIFSPCIISVATHGPPSMGNVIWHCKGINIKRSVWLEFRSMKCWNQGGRK